MINVDPSFHATAFGQVINPIVNLYVSFGKQIDHGAFFSLGRSQLDGPDLLKASTIDSSSQDWDFYRYHDYTDRLVDVSWERQLEFPYQIQCGMADFTLDNSDGYFTPLNQNSPIGKDNLPSRPFRLYAGYYNQPQILPQFVGLTQGMPNVSSESRTVEYHGVDFLYNICNHNLRNVVNLRDVTTDVVIAAILQDYGLAPSQYLLSKGLYNIPFIFFDIGEDAGTALKQLVQSENGYMWLDEKGIVRFETASNLNSDTEIVATLTDYDIVSLTTNDNDSIVNHVRIQADMREVQEWQEVYTKVGSESESADSIWAVYPNESLEVSCALSDPCYNIATPTIGEASSVSWFTATDQTGAEVKTGVTASGKLTSSAYNITFKNNRGIPIIIKSMALWGEPAKIYDQIKYDAYDDESVEKYGDQLLEISDNRFFQSYYQADAYARTIISQRKKYGRNITAQIKGDFSFQLMDQIKIETTRGDYNGVYRILGISYNYDGKVLTTSLILNGGTRIEPGKFMLNISKLNGEDSIQ